MTRRAILVLSDGSVYRGQGFGANADACGEVVFNTSMTGYQEMLTDPAHAGQIVVPTYPLIGNCGINSDDIESPRLQVRGFVIREAANMPNHYQSSRTLDQYLAEAAISGISELDTRAITRKLRTQGTMMGIVTSDKTPEQALELLNSVPRYGQTNFVKDVSTRSVFRWQDDRATHPFHLAVLDCGVNYGILRALSALDCAVTVVPSATSAEEILNLKPNGVIISPGPGNPDLLGNIVSSIEKLIGRLPIMGICLGAQLITHAFGGKSLKLSFGHRGANQPVRELRTKRVHITSQNHTYVPDPDSLPSELGISHVSLNDGTIEGVRHKSLPIFAVQYWTEASPRTLGSFQVFEEFLEMVRGAK